MSTASLIPQHHNILLQQAENTHLKKKTPRTCQPVVHFFLFATMSIILYALRKAHRDITTQPSKPRNRLQKNPKAIDLYSCREILNVIRVQTCLTLFSDNHDEVAGVEQGSEAIAQPHHIGTLIKSQPPTKSKSSIESIDSISIYSMHEMEEPFKRTRSKTPVTWIGQLESYHKPHELPAGETDPTKLLAGQYQAVLPPRTFTPCPELDQKHHLPRNLRKMKGRQSLRDLVTCQEIIPESPSHSDSDTLCGSESPHSLASPSSGHFSFKSCEEYPEPVAEELPRDEAAEEHNGIAFKICLDMLTDELATGLFKKHPTEALNRASGLQIMLMIESYEQVQQHIRREIYGTHVTEIRQSHVKALEILDNWLEALYSLYDTSNPAKISNFSRPLAPSRTATI